MRARVRIRDCDFTDPGDEGDGGCDGDARANEGTVAVRAGRPGRFCAELDATPGR